jgi:hypothetical protein
MLNYDLIERNKNIILNIGIIVLALFIAFRMHSSSNVEVNTLIEQQGSELEKNKVAEDIAMLEQKSETYKKTFIKRDLAAIMDILTGIAKNTSVKILSVKPYTEEAFDSYFNSSFLITLNAPGYHALSNFISKIESHKDIYLVSEINISSALSQSNTPEASTDLGVSLKINIISYL